ncbi:MAG: TonB-dependent receptor [Marinifilaceae bacterium]|jgi:TonB-linked SusC/RagA family outer membrane protein|nr:TonB-dependent receptor [Marinifilaceae bacterium]
MKRNFLILVFCLLSFISRAQNNYIRGRIIDSKNKEAIAGVNIQFKENKKGACSDINGYFSILSSNKSELTVFKFLGMKTKEMKLNANISYIIEMEESSIGLNEISITGYDKSRKKNIIGAVKTIKSTEFANRPIFNIEKILQSKVAGVRITSQNGSPGSDVSVRIRGGGSLTASNLPMYIIDGIQMPLRDINSDDIESIDIIKDAASASIYGVQAANGVVIIKTKSGIKGKTKIEFQASHGISKLIKKIDILNSKELMELSIEAMDNYVNTYRRGSTKYYDRYYKPLIETYKEYGLVENEDGSLNYDAVKTYDWQKEVFRTGKLSDYNLSISGGNDKNLFYISGSYNKLEGHVKHTSYDKFTIRTKLSSNLNERTKIKTNISFSRSNRSEVAEGGTYSNPHRGSLIVLPFNNPYDENGNYNMNPLLGDYDYNFLQSADYDTRKTIFNILSSSINLEYRLANNLYFKSDYNLYYQDKNYKQKYDPRTHTGKPFNGRIDNNSNKTQSLQTNQIVSYNQYFGKHYISSLAGFSFKNEKIKSDGSVAYGLPSYHFDQLNSTAIPISATGDESDHKLAGIFTKLSYQYADKYLLNLTVRRDGSSKFSKDSRWGLFPSLSTSWRISEEKFMQNLNFIDNLKLKFAYGETGSCKGISDHAWRKSYSSTSGSYMGKPGIQEASMGNSELTWEKNKEFNYGIDFSLFKGRIRGEVDIYQAIKEDLLYNRPIPSETGYSSRPENIGELENKGIEFNLDAVAINKKDIKWTVNFNISKNKNRLKKLYDNKDYISYYLKVGEPVFTYKTYKWAGVNPADGRPMFYDKDNNITYEPKEEDKVWVGSIEPTVLGGFGTDISYKNLQLSMIFNFQSGGQVKGSDMSRLARSGNTLDRNQYQSQYDDRWQKPGDITWVAKPSRNSYYYYGNDSESPYKTSTRNFMSTDYLRLKNIMLSYYLPKEFTDRLKLEKLQLYAQATNILTFSNFKGWDPEFTGTEYGIYPTAKNYSVGIKLSF